MTRLISAAFAAANVRACLLATTALVAMPGLAHAAPGDDPGRPVGVVNTPYEDESQIVISQPGTPTTAQDPADVNGVGQMTIASPAGGLGLCTGTLINPRTVIFAAHCVNTNAAGGAQNPLQYGSQGGGIPIAFGFKQNNLQAVRDWFLPTLANGAANPGLFKTNTANFLYNVNQVVYNPSSLALGTSRNFIQADIAIATLDTPAANVPTWTILLSALPAPASISETAGTGYHVTLTGYGRNGVGTLGDTGGIDYRRRVAENYIGLLGSFDDRDAFLFGSTSGLPQNLYQIDFDDPRRGTSSASPFDFNLFKDNPLPNEGTTAGGDSGGPLILDKAFAKPTVIGVLSGGSRFFGAQPFSTYGTSSFYQPLYLYWDYIVANNPYRYARAAAGDGLWSDAAHWVTALDPAYQIIVDGKLANGLPTSPGTGLGVDSTKFGQVCFQTNCYDVKTGIETINGRPVDATDSGIGSAAVAGGVTTKIVPEGFAVEDVAHDAKVDLAMLQGQDIAQVTGAVGAVTAALPPATVTNGLPGATGFVPNNVDPDRTTGRTARYYDVTLGSTGTTTLNTSVTIDRFTIAASTARLNVTNAGSLRSLMDVTQLAGTVQVDGTINSVGDYLLFSGLLTGSGRINAPYFTSISGMIAPGTTGTIGTLTIGGNAVLASGNRLLVDVGPNNTSDTLAVVATTFNGTRPTNGIASIGGSVGFAPVAGHTIRANDLYTILTAQGGYQGAFGAPTALSAILTPTFIYNANSVQARITAGTYASVVANTPVQTAFAGLLDRNRSNYSALTDLYGVLDLQNAATIQSNLEGLAPRTETLKRAIGTVALDNMSRFYRERLSTMDTTSGLGGTLAVFGKPGQVASLAASTIPGAQQTMSDTGGMTVQEGRLPEDMSAFIAGGYLDGSSRSMRGVTPQGNRDQFDGYYGAVGVEKEVNRNVVFGFAVSYTNVEGTTDGVVQQATGELFQGTVYGKAQTAGFTLDGQFSAGAYHARTDRTVALGTNSYRLRSSDRALTLVGEIGVGKMFDLGTLKVGPRISGRAARIAFSPTAETGGGPQLVFARDNYDSLQGRAGLALSGGMRFRPYLSAYYVHDFNDQPGVVSANFAGGIGPNALFALAGQDQNWGEVGGGLAFGSDKVELSVGADTTVERSDVRNQSYRGTIKVRF